MSATSAPVPGSSPFEDLVRRRIEDSLALTRSLLDHELVEQTAAVAARIVEAYRNGRKLLLFGNGGSAADAQHLAGEMSGRFLLDRAPLAAVALGDNVAAVTAIGNDYSFAEVFSRQLEGLGQQGDVAIGLSTSGRSENVVAAIETARRKGLVTVGFTGRAGSPLQQAADYCLCVPSTEVPRIQEAHALLGHILCELVEAALFPNP